MSEIAPLSDLFQLLGIKPQNKEIYKEALTHGSGNGPDYQRLEFLGDRVLGLAIAKMLFDRFKSEPEGKLSQRLNALVSGETCAEIAREHDVGRFIMLGKQARDDGGRDSDNILGDVVESLIGAVYCDLGHNAADSLIARLWGNRLTSQARAPRHPKSTLQEWAASNRRKPPEYTMTERGGPPHAPTFTVEVEIYRVGKATGRGSSKQEAEKEAANTLLSNIEKGKTS